MVNFDILATGAVAFFEMEQMASGSWSLYTFLVAVIMCGVSLVVLVGILIAALSGGFSARSEQEYDEQEYDEDTEHMRGYAQDEEGEWYYAGDSAEHEDDADYEQGGKSVAAQEDVHILVDPPEPPKRPSMRQSGLLYMLIALAMPLLGWAVFILGEDTNGPHSSVTVATVVVLVLLAAQLGLAFYSMIKQRRL